MICISPKLKVPMNEPAVENIGYNSMELIISEVGCASPG
jgi:hypothetical protein